MNLNKYYEITSDSEPESISNVADIGKYLQNRYYRAGSSDSEPESIVQQAQTVIKTDIS